LKNLLATVGFALLLLHADFCLAIDSYRYLHVSIDTPWMIFLFLLVAVFIPFILMLFLMWRRPMNKSMSERDPKTPGDE
jgi:hypothetical protein